MQRKFITNLAFLIFLTLLIKPFWILGIDRTVQNTVGAHNYGLYAALFNFSFLFNIILDCGITTFNVRNIAQHKHLLNKHFSSLIFLRMVLAVGYFVISMCIALLFGYEINELWILSVLLLNQMLISFILYLRSNIAGLQFFKTDSLISVLDRLIMIIICGALLWGNLTNSTFKIEWYIWAQTSAYLITIVITFTIVALKAKFNRLKWNSHFFLVILKQSYPFAILILVMTCYNRFDSVMLERIIGPEQSGIYAQAYRLLDATNMFPALMSGLLLPMFAFMIKKKESLVELVELSFSLVAVPAIIIMTLCFFFSNEIMGMLYDQHVEKSAEVFRLIMSCFLAISSVYVFGTLLTANGNLKYLNIVTSCGLILNISLNLYLIPLFEAKGAAFSSLLTQYITAGLQIILAHKVLKLKFKWNLCFRYLLFIFLCASVFYFSHEFKAHWISAAIFGGTACAGLSLALFLIKPREMFRLVRSDTD